MSNSSNNSFDLSAYVPKSAREHPATEGHSVENVGEDHLLYSLKSAAVQLHAVKGAVCLALGILVNLLVAMPLGTELVGSAHAQTVPKSLEQGGPDAALRQRKNDWTVGVAGGSCRAPI